MGNGDLLKLSQEFHKKMDSTFSAFGMKLDGMVQSHHETEFEVREIGSEVKVVKKEVDDHIENHSETKRDWKGFAYAVFATVLAAVLIAIIMKVGGATDG